MINRVFNVITRVEAALLRLSNSYTNNARKYNEVRELQVELMQLRDSLIVELTNLESEVQFLNSYNAELQEQLKMSVSYIRRVIRDAQDKSSKDYAVKRLHKIVTLLD